MNIAYTIATQAMLYCNVNKKLPFLGAWAGPSLCKSPAQEAA